MDCRSHVRKAARNSVVDLARLLEYPVYLFLNDLGVLDHRDAVALGNFAFEGDGFAGVFGELIIHRSVIADDEIGFALARDSDRSATSDAFRRAGGMFVSRRVVIDIAHHVDHFASNGLACGGVEFLFALLLGESEGREDKSCRESRRHSDFQNSWIVPG